MMSLSSLLAFITVNGSYAGKRPDRRTVPECLVPADQGAMTCIHAYSHACMHAMAPLATLAKWALLDEVHLTYLFLSLQVLQVLKHQPLLNRRQAARGHC